MEAMEKGYSQLLIHDTVIDLKNLQASTTSQDLMMMMMGQFSAKKGRVIDGGMSSRKQA